MTTVNEITVSNSEIATWTRCRRQWFVTYYLGFVPDGEPATGNRQLGTNVHTALEGHYGYQLDPLAVLGVIYQLAEAAHPDDSAALRAERDLAEAMVSGYLEWVAAEGKDANLEVAATEAEVRVPLPGVSGVMLRARMDQVSRRISDGALGFMDYKTAANFDKHELLALDPQMRFYCLVQHLASRQRWDSEPGGRPVVMGGWLTTLRRVKRSATSKPPYYARDEFWFNPTQLDSMLARVVRVCSEIVEARRVLDGAYAAGGQLDVINAVQRMEMYPTPILSDCRWSCPLASGLCVMMDDGSDWAGALTSSGKWRQADPYEYYRADPLRAIRAELARL